MDVYDLKTPTGELYAFEVSTTLLGRRGACRVAARIPGARLLRGPRTLSWLREASFCEFEVGGVRFEIEEPFGDNSRYWVGPAPPGPGAGRAEALRAVRAAFERAGAFGRVRAAAG